MKHKILVTGIGGDIGQSIGKIILKYPDLFETPIGTDINNEHSGIFISKDNYNIPRVDAPEYVNVLNEIVYKHEIDLIIPTSEPEIKKISTEFARQLNAPVLIANPKSLEIGFDKLKTNFFLKENNLPFPNTSIIDDIIEIEKPIIVKSRFSSGSKNIFILNNSYDLDYFKRNFSGYLAQEYIDAEDKEYTCCLFRDKFNNIKTISFLRRLNNGVSVYGELINDEKLNSFLIEIAIKINLLGSINVQLRMLNGIPFIFEINPRFSSTVLFRELLGFSDLIWSIKDKLNIPISYSKPITNGAKFYRSYNEHIIIDENSSI